MQCAVSATAFGADALRLFDTVMALRRKVSLWRSYQDWKWRILTLLPHSQQLFANRG